MLINIKVSNFLSYDSETELSMNAGKIRRDLDRVYQTKNYKILKCMAIFGTNASGKSNFIKAISFMKRLVIQNNIPNEFFNKYYRLNPENADKSSLFEITLLIDNKVYVYGFEVCLSKNEILKEWLYEKTVSGVERYLFKMDNQDELFEVGTYFKQKGSIERLKIYGDDCIGTNSLFLSNINDKKDKMFQEFSDLIILKKIYRWFKFKLNIHFPLNQISMTPDLIKSNIERITKILNAFGTGITDVQIITESIDKIQHKIPKEMVERIYEELLKKSEKNNKSVYMLRSNQGFYTFELDKKNNLIIKTIQFAHEKEDIYFNLEEESDGTARLLDLIGILLDYEGNKVFVFDEIERCLHPSLTVRFLELFLELAKERNTQLIITTHESRILAVDLLRNDEICYTVKNQYGASRIVSVDGLNIRADKKLYQAFFEGETLINAIPTFDDEKLWNEVTSNMNSNKI